MFERLPILLKTAGVPRKYRKQVIDSFEPGTISVRDTGGAEYGIRYLDGKNAMDRGRYLTQDWPASRETLALLSEWNQMTGIKQRRIAPGAPMITGRVAGQGQGYPGGGTQVYVLDHMRDLLEPQSEEVRWLRSSIWSTRRSLA